ncbi:DMT family transporter [Flavobacterium undicola]|uniref:DMT family transporter n=1 Tax=Flavobacterium undicola TaxID=1932779 RepID=UPI001377DCB0|nr:DMT family transporter [Flavobacterium undicola]MBA0882093.1 DMT family transporter [Flavobacterium undicola]
MNNAKPKLALALGILCISIFPILVRLQLTNGLISAFYRMFIAAVLLLPYVIITRKFKRPPTTITLLAVVCGLVFATDIAIWNIAIQKSSATQATLLANLSPVWVGIGSFLVLKNKPSANFWIGTAIALMGMVTLVGFETFAQLNFDLAFVLAVLSGMLYATYILISKNILSQVDILSFMSIVLVSSSLFLALVCGITAESFSGFSNTAWLVLFIQGAVCQLTAWLLISYSTQHLQATRVSLSLLGQAVLATLLAWLFLDEKMSWFRIIGAVFLLLGIRITFYNKPIGFKNLK